MLERNIKLLSWFNFFTDFRLYAPIAIIYFANVSGSFALGMAIFSITMVASALFEIPTGIFSDLIGRKKTVILGALAAVIYSIFYAIGLSFWFLAFGAVFEGLSRSFYSGNNDALLHDYLSQSKKEDQFDEYLGRTDSMFQVALAVSAVLGAILAMYSFPLIMWLSVIPQVIALILASRLTDIKRQTVESGNIYSHLKEAFSLFIKNSKLRWLSLASIISYGFGEAGYQFQAAFYNTLWPVWAVGMAKVLSNVGAAFSFRFSGRIIKKYNALPLLLGSSIYAKAINLFAAAIPTIISPLLMTTTSLFHGINSVAKNTLLQKEFASRQRATMGSLNAFAGSLFFGLVAILIGLMADTFSPAAAIIIIQLLSLPTIFIYTKLSLDGKQSKR